MKKVKDSKTTGSGAEDVYIPKLWYYDLLLFTIDDVLPQPSLDSRTPIPNDEYEGVDITEEIFDEDDQSKKLKFDEEVSTESSDVSLSRIAQKSMVRILNYKNFFFFICT